MQRIIYIIFFLFTSIIFSQDKKSEEILNEGKLLFRLEKGSWYGTDHMLATFPSKRDSIGGYLSYETSNNTINTIFFSRFDSNEVLLRYEFDSIPKSFPIRIDTTNSSATDLEKNLIEIRLDASERAYSNEDGFFKFYEDTALNFIPVINGNRKLVFILTGPQTSGIVLIGNDYKLFYNKKNKLSDKKRIHKSILEFPFVSGDENKKTVQTFHSHVITQLISSTDICTLLLYKDYIEWNQHIVLSKKKVSIFDIEKERLVTMKRKAWEKIKNY